MKNAVVILLSVVLFFLFGMMSQTWAQVPNKMNYQAVARNASGQVLPNQNVALRISIRQNTAAGAVQYQELHAGATNAQGLLNLQIGGGAVLSGNFADITWADGLPKFLQIELDPAGGAAYLNMGTQQLVSVPYAMVAGSVAGGGAFGWSLSGNAGTDPSTHFVGTTDAQPLNFRVNNVGAGRLSETNTAIGANALPNLTTGTFNEAFGVNALINNAEGNNNVAAGTNSLYNNTASGNTAVGRSALQSNATGYSNVALGIFSLYNSVNRSNLVAVGDSALFNNNVGGTTGLFDGEHNTAVGSKALFANTTGSSNTALGFNTLFSNTTGVRNTANGKNALYANIAGIDNTAIGFEALRLNTSGGSNTALGSYTLYSTSTGNFNTGMGYFAAHNNTTGYANTASGCLSLFGNTTGMYNSAYGTYALYSNTIGYSNVAIGTSALQSSVNRSNNVAVGDSALYANGLGVAPNSFIAGEQNTAVGSKTLLNNTTGWQNTAIGYHALYNNVTGTGNTALGVGTLYANTNGAGNVAIGHNALSANTSGQLNVAVGDDALYGNSAGWYNTGVGVSSGGNVANLTNSVAVGYGSFPNNSNVALLGNTTTSCGGFSNWNNWSDGRFKVNVQENVVGLAFINALRPITYTADMHKLNAFIYRDKAEEYENNLKDIIQVRESEIQSGFIAQEVAAAAQKTGYVFNGVTVPIDPSTQYYSLSYAAFVVPLVKAVQEQQNTIEQLQQQNALLLQKVGKIDNLEAELERIKQLLINKN
ncbi:MAG TPA: tail fiber domain-containing protein [Chitinophagales bacterium]|nr:tail fiber domain-containing protein [Chitinophagales bacterium]